MGNLVFFHQVTGELMEELSCESMLESSLFPGQTGGRWVNGPLMCSRYFSASVASFMPQLLWINCTGHDPSRKNVFLMVYPQIHLTEITHLAEKKTNWEFFLKNIFS